MELVEQPVPAADLDGMAWVTERVSTPVMADESVYGVRDLVEVIRRRAADLVNVKLAKCGGLAPPRRCSSWPGPRAWAPRGLDDGDAHRASARPPAWSRARGTSRVADLDAAWWAASSPSSAG